MYYVTWGWHVKSPNASAALEPLMLLTAPWRLSLLFVVSGAASAFLLRSRPEGYLRERTRRLLLPLLFGMLVIVVPQAYYEVVERLPGGYHNGYFAFYQRYLLGDPSFCRDGECLTVPTWNHLWFLPYLWAYVTVVWLAVRLFPKGWRSATNRWLSHGPLARAGALWFPVAWLVCARVLLNERFGSTHALVDDWYNHAQYFPLFALGFAVARVEPFWASMHRLRWQALGLATVTYFFLAWYFGFAGFGEFHPSPDWLRDSQRILWGVNQWSAIVAILGFGQVLRHVDSPILRYLVPAVLPVYILHQTVIVVLAHNLQPLRIPPAFEAPFLVAATFGLCFGGYEVIRRCSWLRPLFGLKRTAQPKSVAGTAEARSWQ
jgi:glucans biosynthesis protein C